MEILLELDICEESPCYDTLEISESDRMNIGNIY